MDVWVVLFFLAFMNYMPTFVYKVWCEHVFHFSKVYIPRSGNAGL